MNTTSRRTAAVITAGAATVLAALLATGTAAAAPPPSPTPSTSDIGMRSLEAMRGTHGSTTTRSGDDDRTRDFQHGTVTATDGGALTVRSPDGFTAVYTVTPDTRVVGHRSAAADAVPGDRVLVVADPAGDQESASLVAVAGPAGPYTDGPMSGAPRGAHDR